MESCRAVRAIAVALLLAAAPGSALGASPLPSPLQSTPEPSLPQPVRAPLGEAWLDAPLPAGAAPGATIRIGAFFWSRDGSGAIQSATLNVRLHPAVGDAEPSFTYAAPDRRGHIIATLAVPHGGLGRLEISLPGTICDDSACAPHEAPIPVLGVGPPPDVPLASIASATLRIPTRIVAGEAATIEIIIDPHIDWPAPGLDLPASIWLQVRIPQGPVLQDVPADRADATASRYAASITFDRPGELVLQAGGVPDAEDGDLFATAIRRIEVLAAPTPSMPSEGDTDPDWVQRILVAVLGVGLVVGLFGSGRRTPA